MSTNSRIGYKLNDSEVKYIYCHWDGYTTWNGVMLNECYNTPEKVKELIDKGNVSSLGTKITNTNFYQGKDEEATKEFLVEFKKDAYYHYLYDMETKEWSVFHNNKEFKLNDVFSKFEVFNEVEDYIDNRKEFEGIAEKQEAFRNNYQSWQPNDVYYEPHLYSVIDTENNCVEVSINNYGRKEEYHSYIPISSFEEGEKISADIYGKTLKNIEIEYGIKDYIDLESAHKMQDGSYKGTVYINNFPCTYEFDTKTNDFALHNDSQNEYPEIFDNYELMNKVQEELSKEVNYFAEHNYDGYLTYTFEGNEYNTALRGSEIILGSNFNKKDSEQSISFTSPENAELAFAAMENYQPSHFAHYEVDGKDYNAMLRDKTMKVVCSEPEFDNEVEKSGWWNGSVSITFADLTEELYNEYFDADAISYDTLEKMCERDERIDISYLSESAIDTIHSMLMYGNNSSLGYDINYELDIECTLEGEDVRFRDLTETSQEHIINLLCNNECHSGEICESITEMSNEKDFEFSANYQAQWSFDDWKKEMEKENSAPSHDDEER